MYETPYKDINEHWRRVREADYNADHCWMCEHFGEPHHTARHRGQRFEVNYECVIHPGVYNTRFSLSCTDFKRLPEERILASKITHYDA